MSILSMKEAKITKSDIDSLMEPSHGGSGERVKILNFQPFLGFSVVISCFIIWDRPGPGRNISSFKARRLISQ